MAEFKLARLRFTWNGEWATGTFYNRDAIVIYEGKAYVCLVPHTSNDFYNDLNQLPINYWQLQIEGKKWSGDWAPDTYYSLGNIVRFGGKTYYCTTNNISTSSFAADEGNWTQLTQGDNWKGTWSTSVNYGVGDIVKYGGNVYRCNTNHVSAGTTSLGLEADLSKWDIYDSGVEFVGTWNGNTQYKLGQLVKYGPDLYKVTTAHQPTTPFNDSYFDLWLPGEEYAATWSANTTYKMFDIVQYGGYEFYSLVNNNLGYVPSTSRGQWDVLTTGYQAQGEWDSTIQYRIGSVVTRGGNTFLGITDSIGADPLTLSLQATYVASGSSGTTVNISGSYLTNIVVGQLLIGTGFSSGQTVVSITQTGANTATVIINSPPDATPSGTINFTGVNSGNWQLLVPGVNWKGFWAPGTNYLTGDLVLWQNATYRCIQVHSSLSSNSPVADITNTYWVIYLLHARNNASSSVGDLTTYANGIYTNVNIGPDTYSLRVVDGIPAWRFINKLSNIYYVATNGIDSPTRGVTLDNPWRTIAYAAQTLLNGTINQNAAYLLKSNKEFIVEEMYQWMLYQKAVNGSLFSPGSNFDETKTKRDARLVIDAIVYDLTRGGNSQTVAATLAYFAESGAFINDTVTAEIPYFIAALNYLTTLVGNVLANELPTNNYQLLNAVSPSSRISQVIDTSYTSETGQIVPANDSTLTVTNSGSMAYNIDGTDKITLNLIRGYTYTFSVDAVGHPFWIQTTGGGYVANNVYSKGVLNAGTQSGDVTFTVPYDAPDTLFYQCQYHPMMWGTINVYDVTANISAVPSASSSAGTLLGILTSALTNATTADVPPPNSGISATIYVKSGSYSESLPIIVPENVAIVGDELRSVTVLPVSSYTGITTSALATQGRFYVVSTAGLTANMPLQFDGTPFGGITIGTTYYVIGSSITSNSFSISLTPNGSPISMVDGLGSMYVYAGDALKDMFYMRNGSGLRNLSTKGLLGTLSAANQYETRRPTGGAFVSLDPGDGIDDTTTWIFRRSPYVQNVTTFGKGCSGLKVDGTLHNGGYKSIVANDFTQIISDGIGAWVKGNDAKSELISVFSYYCYAGYFAEDGGRIRAANGNCSYGQYGAIAEGFDDTETPLTGNVYNQSTQVQASVQSSLGLNAQLLRLQYANAGKGYSTTTTNLLKYTNDFLDNVWTNDGNISFVKNYQAPTGYVEAWLLSAASGAQAESYLEQAITITPSGAKYTGLSGTNLSGSGVNATFDVTVTGNNSYLVAVNATGTGYVVGNQIKISGAVLGGIDGTNDLIITVASLSSSSIATVTTTGTVPIGSSKPYLVSLYVKQGTATKLDMFATFSGTTNVTSNLNFTFSSGTATVNNTITLAGTTGGALPVEYGAIPVGNDWYRIWFTTWDTIGTNNTLTVRLYPSGYATRTSGTYSYVYGAQVQSSTVNATLGFYLENTSKTYTAYANYEITGSGTGAVIEGDEIRSGAVFESRVISGGASYLTASNNAQGGTSAYVILAGSDTNTANNYTGMRVFINSGTGTGQYGYIGSYDSTYKIAQVLKESFDTPNITSTSSSTNAFTLGSGDTTQMYVNMPVQFIPTTYYVPVTNASRGHVTVTNTTGGTANKLRATSTANLQLYMPIVFTGTTFGSITTDYTFFVASIDPNGLDFQVSTTQFGSVWPLTTATGSMEVNFPTNTGYFTGSTSNMSINMPVQFSGSVFGNVATATSYYVSDIIDANTFTISSSLVSVSATDTTASTNVITIGSSTSSLVPFNPIIFTGSTFGNIQSGATYYVNKIVGPSTFTVASSLIYTTASTTEAISNLITVESTSGFVANQPVRFTGTAFGGLTSETTYYVLAINNSTSFTISSTPGGSAVNLTSGAGNLIVRTTANDFVLTTASGTMVGNTTANKFLGQSGSGSMTAQLTTALYGGVSPATTYYVYSVSSGSFQITGTVDGASPISLTSGTGNMSVAAVGWDHIIPGYPIATTLDNTTVYYVEPRTIYEDPSFSQSAVTLTNQGSNTYTNVAYGNNYFVAIAGNSATASISQNGTTWSPVTLPSASNWSAIAYGNFYWVAIASASNTAIYSSANGQGWRSSTLPTSTTWTALAFGMGTFVAIASSGTSVAYSTNNGATWSAGSGLPSASWSSICYGGGRFVAVATGGTQAAYSTDGITWTSATLPASTTWSRVRYGNGRFVAVSSSNTYSAYSFDGITWYSSNLQIQADTLAYGQGVFLALKSDSSTGYTSEDGATWKPRTVSASAYASTVFGYTSSTYNGVFISVGAASTGTNIFAGAKAKGRAVITAGNIVSMNLFEPGSNYSIAPGLTYNDPNNTTDAVVSPRIGNGALGNPTIISKGQGYSLNSTYILITGNGYADAYQTGYTLILNNLSRIPNPGDNLTIAGNDTIYKVTSATIMYGTTAPHIEANVQVSPNITADISPDNLTAVSIRQKYSQVRLTGHDFLNIGYGNQAQSNYPNVPEDTSLQSQNQTVETNFGRVFYVSTDQDGNFKVGNLFGVQQSTGIVTLSASQFGLTGLSTLSLGGIAVGGSSVVINQFSTDGTLAANSDAIIPTQRAIKTYVTSRLSQGGANTFTGNIIAGTISIGNPNFITNTVPAGIAGSTIQMPKKVTVNGPAGAWGGGGAAYMYFVRSFERR